MFCFGAKKLVVLQKQFGVRVELKKKKVKSFCITNEDIVTSRMETSGLDSACLHGGKKSWIRLSWQLYLTLLLNRMKKQENTEDICYNRKNP